MKSAFKFCVFLSALFLAGCGPFACYELRGPVTQWTYYIADFDKIRVYNAPQIYITQGDTQSVVVEAEENMFQVLHFNIDPFEKRLFIDFIEDCTDDIDVFKIYITVDTLREIDLRGGGEVWIEDTLKADDLSVLISGDAEVNIGKLQADRVFTQVSGSGTLHYAGFDTVSAQTVDVSGLGRIFSYGLLSKNVNISVSGGGIVQTTVSDSLNVSISGTADVYYKGHPAIIENITGTGQVIDEN